MLRIIAGSARGIRIKTPETVKTRPTLDRVKESVFNILQPYMQGAKVLDLFAGSGNLGIESLSRGADHAVFVDESKLCRDIIGDNLDKTKLREKGEILLLPVDKAIHLLGSQGRKFDMVFMDPPYNSQFVNKTLQIILENGIMIENGVIAVEHHEDENAPEGLERLERVRFKQYGDTCFSFYLYSS